MDARLVVAVAQATRLGRESTLLCSASRDTVITARTTRAEGREKRRVLLEMGSRLAAVRLDSTIARKVRGGACRVPAPQ